jgi:hypothetical protein
MNKTNDTRNFIWPVVIVILLMLALIAGAVFYFFEGFTSTVDQGPVKTTLTTAEKATQDALFIAGPKAGAELKPADKLIFKTVNFDAAGKIAEIIMFSPEIMADGLILIDGKSMDVIRSQEGDAFLISFQIPEDMRKNELTFFVVKNEKQMATCSFSKNEILTLVGDCIF